MTETNNTQAAENQEQKPKWRNPHHGIHPFEMEKHGVKLPLEYREETRGTAQGDPYIGIDDDKTKLSLDDYKAIFGEDFLLRKLGVQLKKGFKEVYARVLEANDKKFDLEKWKAEFSAFNFVTESMKQLKDKQENLLMRLLADEITSDEFKTQSKILKAAIDRKSRKTEDEDEDEVVA